MAASIYAVTSFVGYFRMAVYQNLFSSYVRISLTK
jgi:hypothetical protein